MLTQAEISVSHSAALLECLTVLIFVAVVLAAPVFADIHPIPLDKNADSAMCLECHGDKAKGKSVHTAVTSGCTSCHEIRVNRDVTRVKLITTTTYGLCLMCHADKNAAELKGTAHRPAVRDCVKCHDPHTSDNSNQLLKPTSGDQKENLCLSCHNIGVNVPQKGSRHPALDMGCETCHVMHKTGEAGKAEFDFHLTKASPALCIDCHDPRDVSLQKAHEGQPFGTADCLQCHDPHQSNAPKLMARFLHQPFADKQCAVCHAPAQEGKVVLTQADAKSLCVTCHDEIAKQIETAKVQHPGAAGDCTDCHNPHASRQPGLPKTNGVDICLGCHTDMAELLNKKKVHHRPVAKDGCGTCHTPHGGGNEKLLRVQDANALCLECHGPEAPAPTKLADERMVAIFGGKVRLPEDDFKNRPILPIQYGLGHPTERHPVGNILNTKTKKPVALNCLTCHQPHASTHAGLLVNDQENNMAFCRSCHSEGTMQLQ